MTDTLTLIATAGNRPDGTLPNRITCTDGFSLSVIAGPGTYCTPRQYPSPYTTVEVGLPSERPEPWADWSQRAEDADEPTETVYGYVPVEMVRALIDLHGGEAR